MTPDPQALLRRLRRAVAMTVLFVFTTFTVLTLIACTIAVPGLLILWGVLVAGVGLAWAIVEVFGDA